MSKAVPSVGAQNKSVTKVPEAEFSDAKQCSLTHYSFICLFIHLESSTKHALRLGSALTATGRFPWAVRSTIGLADQLNLWREVDDLGDFKLQGNCVAVEEERGSHLHRFPPLTAKEPARVQRVNELTHPQLFCLLLLKMDESEQLGEQSSHVGAAEAERPTLLSLPLKKRLGVIACSAVPAAAHSYWLWLVVGERGRGRWLMGNE